MNEYAVVKVRVKEEHSKECLSPIVLKPQGCQPCVAKYFLSLAIARFSPVIRQVMAEYRHIHGIVHWRCQR